MTNEQFQEYIDHQIDQYYNDPSPLRFVYCFVLCFIGEITRIVSDLKKPKQSTHSSSDS